MISYTELTLLIVVISLLSVVSLGITVLALLLFGTPRRGRTQSKH